VARNLDTTALRSFVTVADTGGVTKAAGMLNLTQSAVSMQLKRLEESLGVSLLDRSARQIGVTPEGEQLLSPKNMRERLRWACPMTLSTPTFPPFCVVSQLNIRA